MRSSASPCPERFQTYPRGVEAIPTNRSHSSANCFRRTLVGLKRLQGRGTDRVHRRFRRTLVGLKHSGRWQSGRPNRRFRRTLVGLKRLLVEGEDLLLDGFRRTLVGLKRPRGRHGRSRAPFQTYPRGVEAVLTASLSSVPTPFQTYPRGVEALNFDRAGPLTQPFQTYPRGVEAASPRRVGARRRRVSDVPSWG